jgi:hypothetical protein
MDSVQSSLELILRATAVNLTQPCFECIHNQAFRKLREVLLIPATPCSTCNGSGEVVPSMYSARVVGASMIPWVVSICQARRAGDFCRADEMLEIAESLILALAKMEIETDPEKASAAVISGLNNAAKARSEMAEKTARISASSTPLTVEELKALGIDPE